MFKITTNKSMKISRGDDSPRFPIVINLSDDTSSVEYKLTPVVSIYSQYLNCRVDTKKWKKKVSRDGVYSFMFLKGRWYLEEEEVKLEDYGIECLSIPENYNTIVVTHNQSECEVYFYICELNTTIDDYLVKKTFSKRGDIVTEYSFKPPRKIIDDDIVSEDGQMMLQLESEDTIDLLGGEYYYLIRVRYYSEDSERYVTTTITNKLPFYVIDDGFDRVW